VLKKNSHIFSTEDARRIARKRLPRMVFDFIEGAAGREVGVSRNEAAFDNIMLQPRVMENVSQRSLTASILDQSFNVPFGVAPMGMCNLACPNADKFLADMAKKFDFPICLSSAASSSIEDMAKWAGHRAWFQLYFSSSEEASMSMVDRALKAGFETLVLTVDVPQVSRRVRDLRNGFNFPFSMTPRAFLDFATHPRWSLRTLTAGAPSPKNFVDKDGNVFHKGKEQPKLFGTLEPTKVKPPKKKVKRRSKQEILLARDKEKKAALKAAVKQQRDFINHKLGEI